MLFPCGYLEEKNLIKQLEGLLENINLHELEIKDKIKHEIDRFRHFNRLVLETKKKMIVPDIDIRNYAKYILRGGSDVEKRELLECLRSRIVLKEKVIVLL